MPLEVEISVIDKKQPSWLAFLSGFETDWHSDQHKAARAGKLMLWSVSGRAGSPDGIQGLLRYDGAASGGIKLSRFNLPQMNATIAKLLALPDGPGRNAAFDEAKRLTVAYAARHPQPRAAAG
jgi:hypothetical protein